MLTLMYHNILTGPAHDLPVAGSQVTLEAFRRQMLRFRHELLNPFEVHAQLIAGKVPRGVLVTFDDGALGVIDAGRVLAELGALGVAFICPGAITSGLWFYKLADALVRATAQRLRWRQFDLALAGRPEKLAAYGSLSRSLFEMPPIARDEALRQILESLRISSAQPTPGLATLDEVTLRQAQETGGLVFANHSWSHPNLVGLPETELVREVEAADFWLRSSGLPTVPWFAFPRGTHDRRVRDVVARYCPLAFGASAYDTSNGIFPRTYVRDLDANALRFALKTVWGGRLGAVISRGLKRSASLSRYRPRFKAIEAR
jgi:peptidoglycan/xylan/chitin deacetylase (PgdA/CDA1 family)